MSLELAEKVLQGERRALAKAISLVANESSEKVALMEKIDRYTGKAQIVGITGGPGAGKSSLINCLIGSFLEKGMTVGVIAIDPSSPFSGGAFLGDRLRMKQYLYHKDVFIRSLATHGSSGGLSRSVLDVVKLMDAFGKDVILVETAGVGQTELDVSNLVETTIVVLIPGAGDLIQAMKAGIMEIGDIFVINKADMPGVDKVVEEVSSALGLATNREWNPPVLTTISTQNQGIDELSGEILRHYSFLKQGDRLEQRRSRRRYNELMSLIIEDFRLQLNMRLKEKEIHELTVKVSKGELDAYTASREILAKMF